MAELKRALEEALKRGDAVPVKLTGLVSNVKGLGSMTAKAVSKIPGARLTTHTIVRAGKAIPVVAYAIGPVLFITAVAEGQDVGEAFIEAVLPVSARDLQAGKDLLFDAFMQEMADAHRKYLQTAGREGFLDRPPGERNDRRLTKESVLRELGQDIDCKCPVR